MICGEGLGYRIQMQTSPVTTVYNCCALLSVPLPWLQGLPECTAGWQVGFSCAF